MLSTYPGGIGEHHVAQVPVAAQDQRVRFGDEEPLARQGAGGTLDPVAGILGIPNGRRVPRLDALRRGKSLLLKGLGGALAPLALGQQHRRHNHRRAN